MKEETRRGQRGRMSKEFSLTPRGLMGRLDFVDYKDRLDVSFELIDPRKGAVVESHTLDGLKVLAENLNRFLYVVKALQIDPYIDVISASDLYANGISINEALKAGLLKREKKE